MDKTNIHSSTSGSLRTDCYLLVLRIAILGVDKITINMYIAIIMARIIIAILAFLVYFYDGQFKLINAYAFAMLEEKWDIVEQRKSDRTVIIFVDKPGNIISIYPAKSIRMIKYVDDNGIL